jgi:hypothetical protein
MIDYLRYSKNGVNIVISINDILPDGKGSEIEEIHALYLTDEMNSVFL